MLITTGNDLPGYEITEVLGETFGLTVRSRHVGSQIGAGFKSLVGGELKGMTKMLAEGREQAIAAPGRGGGGEGRERDRRHALRHVRVHGAGDRDLRLRHGGDGRSAVGAESRPPRGPADQAGEAGNSFTVWRRSAQTPRPTRTARSRVPQMPRCEFRGLHSSSSRKTRATAP